MKTTTQARSGPEGQAMTDKPLVPKPGTKPYVRDHETRKPAKIRTKTRHAVELHVIKGLSKPEAAKVAGMTPSAFYRALARPEVEELRKQLEDLQLADLDKLRGLAQASAIHNALELMNHAEDEGIRARMVELFTRGDKKGSGVVVQNVINSGGYEYPRPGQRVVEIESKAGDSGSDE